MNLSAGETVLIAATHRSGSYFFCDLLSQYGGLPSPEEYLNAGMRSARRLLHAGPAPSNAEILTRLHAHFSTAARRLMIKAMWPAFEPFLSEEPPGLDNLLADAAFVLVRRRDKRRQAVSYAKALQTGVWRERAEDKPANNDQPLLYSYRQIYGCYSQILADESAWLNYFTRLGVLFHEVWYEDLLANCRGTMDAVLGFLKLEPVMSAPPVPGVRPVSDQVNAEWTERFVARQEGACRLAPVHGNPLTPEQGRSALISMLSFRPVPARKAMVLAVKVENRGTAPWIPYAGQDGFSTLRLILREELTGNVLAEEEIETRVCPGETVDLALRLMHEGQSGKIPCELLIEDRSVEFDGVQSVIIEYAEDPVRQELIRVFGAADPANWTDWFTVPAWGSLYSVSFPWIYQFEHGWVQLLPELCTPGVVVFEDPKIGRLKICLSNYPEMIRLKGQSEQLIRFEGIGADKLRTFVDLDGSSRSWTVPVNEPETLV